MGLIDTAVGAGMGLLTGGYERNQAEKQNQTYINQQKEASKELTENNRQAQMKMWRDTNYSAQMKEMTKAGLNAGLIYGMGGAGGTTANVNAAAAPSGGAGSGRNDVQGGMGIALQTALTQAQTQLMEAQKEKVGAETENVKTDTEGKGLQNTWEKFLQGTDQNEGSDGTPLKERNYRVETNQKMSQIQKIDGELQKMGVDMRKGEAEIERIKSSTELQKQLKEYKDNMNPLELEQFKREIEVYEKNPANNEVMQWIKAIFGLAGDVVKIGR